MFASELASVRVRSFALGSTTVRNWRLESSRLNIFSEEVGSILVFPADGKRKALAASWSSSALHVLSSAPIETPLQPSLQLDSFWPGGRHTSCRILGDAFWEHQFRFDARPNLVPVEIPGKPESLAVIFPRSSAVLLLRGPSLQATMFEITQPENEKKPKAGGMWDLFANNKNQNRLRSSSGSDGGMSAMQTGSMGGLVYFFQEGANFATLVDFDLGGSPSATAAHLHVPAAGGIRSLEPSSAQQWLVQGIAGGAGLLTWPREGSSTSLLNRRNPLRPFYRALDVAAAHDPKSTPMDTISSRAALVRNDGIVAESPTGHMLTAPQAHLATAHGFPAETSTEGASQSDKIDIRVIHYSSTLFLFSFFFFLISPNGHFFIAPHTEQK